MRNRFKPVLTTSRRGRPSTASSTNANSEGTVSSNSPAVNTQLEQSMPKANEEEKSSESLKSNKAAKQGDADSAAVKTPLASSTPAVGTLRRSRIKPAVTSVARSRPNAANKGKTSEAKCSSGVISSKEDNLSGSQGHSCNKDDPLSRRLVLDEQDGQGDVDSVSAALPSDKSPSLKERNQQQALSTRSSTVATPSLTNIEQRSQPVAQEAVIKPSQVQNKNTNSDSAVTQPTDSGVTPSLLRRKRVLPNLGSAARRRRSSVSKENVDKNPDLPEIRQEEEVAPHKDLGHINEQSAVECGGSSRSKRLRTLSEGEKNTDHAMPLVPVSDIHDKGDDDDEEDIKKKGLKRKRGGRPHKLKEPSDPSHMTMQHLIYFNPKTNPMTSSLAGRKKKADEKNKSKNKKGQDANNSQNKESEEETGSSKDASSVAGSPARSKPAESKEPMSVAEDETDGAAVAPRVKVAADGSIILDEESLLIPKSPEKTLNDSEIVYEDADEVNVGAYLKHRKVERWTPEETQTFYKALSQVGTDFSLMGPLFPSRKRRELKAKFKREEKQHRSLVEKALRLRNPIDVELFTPKVDGEEIDDDVTSTDKTSSSHLAQQV